LEKYFVVIRVGLTEAGDLYDAIMKWDKKPIEGVELEEAYQMFGEWDFAILFSADTNTNALHFVGDIVRQVKGVSETSTMPISPVRNFR
jgi:uncharacterized protein with GYD domain